jgi:hypothetical protein
VESAARLARLYLDFTIRYAATQAFGSNTAGRRRGKACAQISCGVRPWRTRGARTRRGSVFPREAFTQRTAPQQQHNTCNSNLDIITLLNPRKTNAAFPPPPPEENHHHHPQRQLRTPATRRRPPSITCDPLRDDEITRHGAGCSIRQQRPLPWLRAESPATHVLGVSEASCEISRWVLGQPILTSGQCGPLETPSLRLFVAGED